MVQRRFAAPLGVSVVARRLIDAAPPIAFYDTEPGALAALRRQIHAAVAPAGRALAAELGVAVTEGTVAGHPVQWVTPSRADPGRTVLYFFGGGHITGSPDEDLAITTRLAAHAGARVCAPHYPLAPEAPYPAALQAMGAVYAELQPVALAGESAGGNLALALIRAAADRGQALPRALALMSPWCDLTHAGDTIQTLDSIDPTLDFAHQLDGMARAYAAGRALDDPGISPLFAAIPPGFPPTIITTGTRDLLLSDCARLSTLLRSAGVTVDLRVSEGMWHVFEYVADLPEADQSMRGIAAFLQHHWA